MNNRSGNAHPSRPRTIRAVSSVVAAGTLMLVGLSGPAAAASTRPPVQGHIDVVAPSSGHIRVAGWSVDRIRPAASNSEIVVVDGVMGALPVANIPRPDVNRVLHITGSHGFSVNVAARVGSHQVCVVSRPLPNTGGQDVILGCRAVTVTG